MCPGPRLARPPTICEKVRGRVQGLCSRALRRYARGYARAKFGRENCERHSPRKAIVNGLRHGAAWICDRPRPSLRPSRRHRLKEMVALLQELAWVFEPVPITHTGSRKGETTENDKDETYHSISLTECRQLRARNQRYEVMLLLTN
jgi:hypothetical protein